MLSKLQILASKQWMNKTEEV